MQVTGHNPHRQTHFLNHEQIEVDSFIDQNSTSQSQNQSSTSSCKRCKHLYYCPQQSLPDRTSIRINLSHQARQFLFIITALILVTCLISFSLFSRQFLKGLIVKLDILQIQKHLPNGKASIESFLYRESLLDHSLNSLGEIYNFCPSKNSTFHVHLSQEGHNIAKNPLIESGKHRAQTCSIPVLGFKDLKHFKHKWNLKYPHNKINLTEFTLEEQEDLLLLLKLYFDAGTYVNLTIPYSQIDNRCWKYLLTGFDALYIDYSQRNESGIYIPRLRQFMKVKFPYSPQIKEMIHSIIKKQNLLKSCGKKQCLIVKCKGA